MDDEINAILSCFGGAVPKFNDDFCEIRIRADRPIIVNTPHGARFLSRDGNLTAARPSDPAVVRYPEMKAAFSRLCAFSVYKHMNSVNHGFITMNGGHRIGVCGTAVCDGRGVHSVGDITSLNIRAAREVRGCSDMIFDVWDGSGGFLLCGAPSSGKTTVLRDIARRLSEEKLMRVSLADERMELASMFGGKAGFDVGLSDVYSGYPKSDAMLLAVRTMSPEYIICDEITGDDITAVMQALNCGVKIIAAAHCDCAEAARRNISINSLIKTGAFRHVIFLSGTIPAAVSSVCGDREVLYDKT